MVQRILRRGMKGREEAGVKGYENGNFGMLIFLKKNLF